MEKRVQHVADQHFGKFKRDFSAFAESISSDEDFARRINQFVQDYPSVAFPDLVFKKRQRAKNNPPLSERCCAKCANGKQCTRRKCDDNYFCGTHKKDSPNGIVVEPQNEQRSNIQKGEVFTQEINGIIYYIDNHGMVYVTEDIIRNAINPRILAKYVKIQDKFVMEDFQQ